MSVRTTALFSRDIWVEEIDRHHYRTSRRKSELWKGLAVQNELNICAVFITETCNYHERLSIPVSHIKVYGV